MNAEHVRMFYSKLTARGTLNNVNRTNEKSISKFNDQSK